MNTKSEPCGHIEPQATFRLRTPPVSRKRQLPLTPAVDGPWKSFVPQCGLESGVSVSDPGNLMSQPPYHNTIQSNLSKNGSGNQESRIDVQQQMFQSLSAALLTTQPTNINTQSTTQHTVTQVESIPRQPNTTNNPVYQSEIHTLPEKHAVQNNDNHRLQNQNDVSGFGSNTALPLNVPIKSDNEGTSRTQGIHYPHLLVNQNPVAVPRFSLNTIHTQTGHQDNIEDGERTTYKNNSSCSTQLHKPYQQELMAGYKQSNANLIPGFSNQIQKNANIPFQKSRRQSMVRQNSHPPQQQYFPTQTVAPSKLPLKRAGSVNIASIPQGGNTSHRYRKYSGNVSYFDCENSLRSIEEGRSDFGNHSEHGSKVRDHFSDPYLVQSQGSNNQKVAEPFSVENLKQPSKHGESIPVCTEFPKTNLMHASSVADFRQFHLTPTHRNSLANRRFQTISMSRVSTLDDGKGAAVKPKKSYQPIQKWSSFSNLEKVDKTGIVPWNISEASKQFVKSSIHDLKPLQQRRKLPVPPYAPKPFDIKYPDPSTSFPSQKLSSSQISNKHASTGDLTTNQPFPSESPQYRRCTSIETSTLQNRFPSQHLPSTIPVIQHRHKTGSVLNAQHSTTDIVKDANNPFRKLIKPSHTSLSQESLHALPNYPQSHSYEESNEYFSNVTDHDNDPLVKRTTKQCYLSLSQEPRDLLRAKLKQAKSMSNLPLFNRNQPVRVSSNSSLTSSPSISRTSLHPNDAFSMHQNRNDRTHMSHSEDFLRDLEPVYHTVHAGMRPPKYLMEWDHKLQYSINKEAEDIGNLSEANSDDMEYLDSRSYFEGEDSQDDDMFYSHVIPSKSPQDQENIAYRFYRDTEDYVDEEGNLRTNPILGRTSGQELKAECLCQSPMASTEPQLQSDRSQEDLQTQYKKSLKLGTSAAGQTQRKSEDASQKCEVLSQLLYSGEDQVIPSGGRFDNCSNPNFDGRRRNKHPTQYVSGHRSRERDLCQQTLMVRTSSAGKVISGNGKGVVSGFGACWVMGACAFSRRMARKQLHAGASTCHVFGNVSFHA